MTGPLPCHACVLVAAAILTLVGGLIPSAARGQSCLCGTAADELVAARLGLEREWVVQVPFDSAAWRLEHVVVGEALVVAQGGDGGVAAMGRMGRTPEGVARYWRWRDEVCAREYASTADYVRIEIMGFEAAVAGGKSL
jgi:hypothetical protein